jgi:hypothetical protein
MDPSFNDFDDNNGVRSPDKVKTERLMEDTRSEYEKQMDEALYLSIQEFKKQEEINRKYEEEILNEHVKIINERKELFQGFLFNLNKLIRLDKDVKEIYEIIEPIIDSYCTQSINHCEIDSVTYDRIFKIIGNVRTNINTVELLKKIIVKSD